MDAPRLTLAFLASSSTPVGALAEASELVPRLTAVLGLDESSVFDIWLTNAEADYPSGDKSANTPVAQTIDMFAYNRRRSSS